MQITKWWNELWQPQTKALNTVTSVTMHNQAYPNWHSWKENKAFRTVDFIYSVIHLLAKKSASIPIWAYNLKGEDLPENDPYSMFLRTMTRAQKYEMFLWYWLRGECFGYKDRFLGANARVEKIYWLNPSNVSLVVTDSFPYKITAYIYSDPKVGKSFTIPLEDMIFVKDFNPSDDPVEALRGLGRIQVLAKRLTKIEANMNNSVAQMQNGGVPGIVFQKDLPMDTKTKGVVDSRKENFARFLNNSDNKGAPFFAGGEMGYLKLGLSTVELDAIKSELSDNKAVCNVFGISDRLFNNDATGSEISDDNARKGLYEDALEPATGLFEDEFDLSLAPDFKGPVRITRFDYSGVKVLQDDMLQVAQSQSASPTFIPNEQRAVMGLPRIDDPAMDKVYFKTGYVPLEDMEGIDPLE